MHRISPTFTTLFSWNVNCLARADVDSVLANVGSVVVDPIILCRSIDGVLHRTDCLHSRRGFNLSRFEFAHVWLQLWPHQQHVYKPNWKRHVGLFAAR